MELASFHLSGSWNFEVSATFLYSICTLGGTRRRIWLRHCATNRKVAGSIPDGVIGIIHNPSGRHYYPAVDSASNRNEYQEYFLGGTGSRCVRLTTLPPSYDDCHEIWGA